jgi:hypothetical protein
VIWVGAVPLEAGSVTLTRSSRRPSTRLTLIEKAPEL